MTTTLTRKQAFYEIVSVSPMRPTREESEAAYVAIKSFQLSQRPLKGNFDLAHLQAIHRHLFSDSYEWAGELRTIDISKGGHMFAHHNHIQSAAAPVFRELAAERQSSR